MTALKKKKSLNDSETQWLNVNKDLKTKGSKIIALLFRRISILSSTGTSACSCCCQHGWVRGVCEKSCDNVWGVFWQCLLWWLRAGLKMYVGSLCLCLGLLVKGCVMNVFEGLVCSWMLRQASSVLGGALTSTDCFFYIHNFIDIHLLV